MNPSKENDPEQRDSPPLYIQPYLNTVAALDPSSVYEAICPERWNLFLASKRPNGGRAILSDVSCRIGGVYFLYQAESIRPVLPSSVHGVMTPLFDDSAHNWGEWQPNFPAMSYGVIPATPGRYSRHKILLPKSNVQPEPIWLDPEEAGVFLDQLYSSHTGARAINAIFVLAFNLGSIEIPVYEVTDRLPDSPFMLGERIYDLKHRQRFVVVILRIELDPRFSYYLCASAEHVLVLLRVRHRDMTLSPFLAIKTETECYIREDGPDQILPSCFADDHSHGWNDHDFMPSFGINGRIPPSSSSREVIVNQYAGPEAWWSTKQIDDADLDVPYRKCWGLLGLAVTDNVTTQYI